MLKVRWALCGLLLLSASITVSAQTMPQMDQKLRQTCLEMCHGANLIAQQRLDRNGWTREINKMIGWGAAVPAEDKEPLINYLVMLFNTSRPLPNTAKALPEGRGRDVFQISCMSCHDDGPISMLRLDRAGWTREVDKMIAWGAYVPGSRREDLLSYLTMHFSR
jgi:cytochrome c5